MFRLLDWVLVLPDDLECDFRQELARFKEEKDMPYVTSIERMARKEGREEAREEIHQALRADILEKYRARWGEPDASLAEKLNQVRDTKQLIELLSQLLTVQSRQDWPF